MVCLVLIDVNSSNTFCKKYDRNTLKKTVVFYFLSQVFSVPTTCCTFLTLQFYTAFIFEIFEEVRTDCDRLLSFITPALNIHSLNRLNRYTIENSSLDHDCRLILCVLLKCGHNFINTPGLTAKF